MFGRGKMSLLYYIDMLKVKTDVVYRVEESCVFITASLKLYFISLSICQHFTIVLFVFQICLLITSLVSTNVSMTFYYIANCNISTLSVPDEA
jgi:hypothetical protein